MPKRHFIGMCTNCINGQTVQPRVRETKDYEASLLKSFDADTGLVYSGSAPMIASISDSDTPERHCVFHFPEADEMHGAVLRSAKLQLELSDDPVGSGLAQILLKLESTEETSDLSGVTDYYSLATASNQRLSYVDLTDLTTGSVVELEAIGPTQKRINQDIIAGSGLSVLIESGDGTFELSWESATLSVDYHHDGQDDNVE